MSTASRHKLILKLSGEGMTATQIAKRLRVHPQTVYQIRHMAKKNGAQKTNGADPMLAKLDGAIVDAQARLEKLRAAREVVAEL